MRDRLNHRIVLVCCVAALAALVSCDQPEDLSFPRPDWREAVADEIAFPLAEPVTLTVGLGTGMTAPEAGNESLEWLTAQTNISLEFVGIPTSPGDIELGQMIRSGRLPDIVAEARVDLSEASLHRLFVDVLEFPALVPSYSGLLRENAVVRAGALSRITSEGRLLSMGTFDPGARPFVGVLAYREDLFRQHDLGAATWPELHASMARLKELYPHSYPFGGQFETMLRLMPSWFGSGYDPQHIVYFHPEAREWRFGPSEDGFREFVTFLADAYAAGLISADAITGQQDMIVRNFSNDMAFLAPYTGLTGPYFRFAAADYGGVNADGEWDGSGRWVSSLELPPAPAGGPRWAGPSRFSPVGAGWLVHTQGDHVAEAIALVDFLFSDEAATVVALGPPGTLWSRAEGEIVLADFARSAYDEGGRTGLRRAIAEQGIDVGLPIVGLELDYYGALGYPDSPHYRYRLDRDFAANVPGEDVIIDPGVRIPVDDHHFISTRVDAVVTLRTHIESQVANFMIGRRPLSEYDEFVETARRMGADRLTDLFNERAGIPPHNVLDPLLNRR